MKLNIFLLTAVTLFVSSCTHQKVQVRRLNDTELSCSQIKKEMEQTQNLLQDINSKTGLSGRNIGMAFLFWPGIVVNEVNASDAERLANERIKVLVELYDKKRCQLSQQ